MFGVYRSIRRAWKVSLICIYLYKNIVIFFLMYLATVLSTLSLIFSDPFQWAIYVFIIPIIHIGVLLFTFIVNVSKTLLPYSVVEVIGKKAYGGLSIANWMNDEIFSEKTRPLMNKGLAKFSGVIRTKSFDADIAKLTLILSALVYEKTDFVYQTALSYGLKHVHIKNYSVQAKHVKFKTSTEVETVHIFYSVKNRVIIVVFKGTDPFSINEVHLDASFEKMYASQFLWGDAHSGFYRAMFGRIKGTSSKRTAIDPMSNETVIIESLDILEESLFNQTNEALNYIYLNYFLGSSPYLFIGGHSLGGALATLFHGRLLKVPLVIPSQIKFLGSYTFGAPKTGSTNFCLEWLAAEEIKQLDKKTTPIHWRVVCGNDIVPQLPLSTTGQESNFANGLLNYTHTGVKVHLHHNRYYTYNHSEVDINYNLFTEGSWWYGLCDLYHLHISLIKKGLEAIRLRDMKSFVKVCVNALIPVFVRDHLTSSYLELLEDIEFKSK